MNLQLAIALVGLLGQSTDTLPARGEAVEQLERQWQERHEAFHRSLATLDPCGGYYQGEVAELGTLKLAALTARRDLNAEWVTIISARQARYAELMRALPEHVAKLRKDLEALRTGIASEKRRRDALPRSATQAIRAASDLISAQELEAQTLADQVIFLQDQVPNAEKMGKSQEEELGKLKGKKRESSTTAESMWKSYYRKLEAGGKITCEQRLSKRK